MFSMIEALKCQSNEFILLSLAGLRGCAEPAFFLLPEQNLSLFFHYGLLEWLLYVQEWKGGGRCYRKNAAHGEVLFVRSG